MMVRTPLTALLALALLLPATATAKSLKRMSDNELIEVLRNHRDDDRREEAATLLGERRSQGAVTYLAQACTQDPDVGVRLHALEALEDIASPRALEEVQRVFQRDGLPTKVRIKAFKILRALDAPRADGSSPAVLAEYRKLERGLSLLLLQHLVDRHRTEDRDLPLQIATDEAADRRLRVAALEATDSLGHPRAYEAFLSFVDDRDKDLRLRCVEGLSRPGWPSAEVAEVLLRLAEQDDDRDLRTAARAGLGQHPSPTLLPELRRILVDGRNTPLWATAFDLFEGLADAGSATTVSTLLEQHGQLEADVVLRLIHLSVRIGDPLPIAVLQSIVEHGQAITVVEEARRAVDLLGASDEERRRVVDSWPPPAVVYRGGGAGGAAPGDRDPPTGDDPLPGGAAAAPADPSRPLPEVPAGALAAAEAGGGVAASAEAGTEARAGRSLAPGPCADAELKIVAVGDVWFDLFVDGVLRIEARVNVGGQAHRVDGLPPGGYHLRVTDFMREEVWSEGRLELACGEVISAEVRDGRGLRVLNHPGAYRPD
jgi:HEAT repeat protein